MSGRFPSRAALAAKIEWEGGLMEALDYGVKTADMPEGDEALAEAWAALEAAHKALEPLAAAVEALLPEPGDDDE